MALNFAPSKKNDPYAKHISRNSRNTQCSTRQEEIPKSIFYQNEKQKGERQACKNACCCCCSSIRFDFTFLDVKWPFPERAGRFRGNHTDGHCDQDVRPTQPGN